MSKINRIKKIASGTLKYLKRLTRKFISDGCLIFSSSIAYYFIFSIFPLMLILISVSGTLINTLMIKTTILDFVKERIPIIYNFTESNIEKIVENRKSIGAVGFIFLIIASSYVFDSIQFSLNRIFKTKSQRIFWKQKLYGLLIISLIFIMILISFTLSTSLFYLANITVNFLKINETASTLLFKILSILIGLIFNFIIFIIIYFFGTNREIHFKHIYKGALVAAVGWELAKHLFITYINNFANLELTYGSVGSIIAFLLWIYISSVILVLGAEINSIDTVQ